MLTKDDLTQIRTVMEDVIAVHPRFDQLKSEILDEVTDIYRDGLDMIDERFTGLESRMDRMDHRMDRMEHRMDNLKIVST